ncbi:MAG: chemotaxis protein CheW [Bacteroidetes bacterium]|nr:chemotaxis protein CheW [Bacteroidota bacterium]
MRIPERLFIFTIEGQRFGLDLVAVQRIERAALITKVPEMPEFIYGIIDYHGKILPVFNLRKKLGLPDKPVASSWRFLILNTANRMMIIAADIIEGVMDMPSGNLIQGTEIESNLSQAAFIRLDDGIIFIYDINSFLSSGDEIDLEKVLQGFTHQSPSK